MFNKHTLPHVTKSSIPFLTFYFLEQAVTSEERVDIPSPVVEMMLIVDTVHVVQTGWDRVGQVDIQTSPPGEHTDGLQGKLTLEMLSFDPLSNGANCSLLTVLLAPSREEINLYT